jgi:hypothetical protein
MWDLNVINQLNDKALEQVENNQPQRSALESILMPGMAPRYMLWTVGTKRAVSPQSGD